jgi:hypothetical protein
MSKVILIGLFLFATKAPKPDVKVTYNTDNGAVSFSAKCPKGWMTHLDEKAVAEYNDGEHEPVDVLRMLKTATCIPKPKEATNER